MLIVNGYTSLTTDLQSRIAIWHSYLTNRIFKLSRIVIISNDKFLLFEKLKNKFIKLLNVYSKTSKAIINVTTDIQNQ